MFDLMTEPAAAPGIAQSVLDGLVPQEQLAKVDAVLPKQVSEQDVLSGKDTQGQPIDPEALNEATPIAPEVSVDVVESVSEMDIETGSPNIVGSGSLTELEPEMPEISNDDFAGNTSAIRIMLRHDVLDVADTLEAGKIGPKAASRKLRKICEDDAIDLDADDIVVDFDAAPEDHGGFSMLAGIGSQKKSVTHDDPIEAALLIAIQLRDRGAALKIIGDTPGQVDKDAYRKSLRKLRDALNANLKD